MYPPLSAEGGGGGGRLNLEPKFQKGALTGSQLLEEEGLDCLLI